MHVILGGTGTVGSALARLLLDRGEEVTVVTRDAGKRAEWSARGASVAVADVHDTPRLREALAAGERLYLLNPPAPFDTDTDAVENAAVDSILAALDGLEPERVVAHSTYGAQQGEALGDLNVLYRLEQGLEDKPYPVYFLRAAYYFKNWDMGIEEARESGVLTSFFPEDLPLPMVAAGDLAEAGAIFLATDECPPGVHHVEGPRRYTPRDVAAAIGGRLGRDIEVSVVPEDGWEGAFRAAGFSAPAARSYARMTAITRYQRYEMPAMPRRGRITLDSYFADKDWDRAAAPVAIA